MAKFLGVDFVPLYIPLKRRLEVLVVVLHMFNMSIMPVITILLMFYMLFTSYWWISTGYALWIAYDVNIRHTSQTGGRRSEWLRKGPLMKYFCNYFPISLHKTQDLDPGRNYIFGYHPHGIISCGALGNFASDATGFSTLFPGIEPYLVTLEANFKWPIVRGYTLWLGLCDASKESITHITTKQGTGNAVVVVIGGAAESLEARPGNYSLTLKNRKGFAKIAIRTGASLVPVFSFGENDLYKQADNPRGSYLRIFQEKFKSIMGFAPPLFYGRGVTNYTFGVLPYRKPINTYVGRPIDVPKNPNPPQDMIDEIHNEYMKELNTLFDANKEKYGISKDTCLNFI